MALPRIDMMKLQDAANGFDTKNHVTYLAEALQCIRDTEDPVGALRLLHAMWGSAFASRDDQRAALHDIGMWLEARLYREPAATPGAIAMELGWLRRFANSASASRESEHARRPDRREDRPTLQFGKRIDRIKERRNEAAKAAAAVADDHTRAPAPLPAPPPPTQLPHLFQVELVDFMDARKARQTARERARNGRPAKERWLPLRPVDPRLRPLATGLVCGVHSTEGFDALFEADQQTFYVTALEERDGKKVAITIALQPPQVDEENATGATR